MGIGSSPSTLSNRRGNHTLLLLWLSLVAGVAVVIIYHSLQWRRLSPADQLRGQRHGAKRWALVSDYCGAPLAGDEGVTSALSKWYDEGRGATLVGLQVVVRHGDRSSIHSLSDKAPPLSCAITDPSAAQAVKRFPTRYRIVGSQAKATIDYLLSNLAEGGKECFPGQLTEKGLLQHLATGRYMRSKYPMLPWAKLTAQHVYFRTTYYPRTFQSGAAFLLGLLPEEEAGPITVHTHEDNTLEPLFGVGLHGASRDRSKDPRKVPDRGFCQRSVDLAADQELSYRSASGVDAELARLFPSVPKVADLSLADQADPLLAATCHGLDLPCDAQGPACPSPRTVLLAKEDADRQFCLRYEGSKGGREATRLAMQPVLKELVGRLHDMATGKPSAPVLALLAAHDTVLAPMVAALSGYDCRWPPYASRVVFELWRTPAHGPQQQHYVRLLYNGKTFSSATVHCKDSSGSQEEVLPGLVPLSCLQEYVDDLLGSSPDIHAACKA